MISASTSLLVLISLCLLSFCQSHSASEWKSRTIYQILTDRFASPGSESWEPCQDLTKYCGGNYNGLIEQLDYIQDMGFDAIWISPFLLNLGDDYHGYAFLDLYQLNPNFGTTEDLNNFISAAHSRDIWVMLDVVGNHVAPVDETYDLINPFNESSYYHPKCQIEDWNDQEEVENCRLANLPDLDQNNSFVRSTLLEWVGSLKDTYDFDGLRIDTIPEVHPDFWSEFSQAAGMYTVGEVLNGDIQYVSQYQQYMDGVLSYPLYYTMRDVFIFQKSMREIEELLGPDGSMYEFFGDVTLLGTFIDNHDNSRFLYTQSDYVQYKNGLTMTLTTVGIPIIYYGSEQGYNGGDDPNNRESMWPNYNRDHELYVFIQALVRVRKTYKLHTQEQVQRFASDDFYSFSRGNVLVCLTNAGANGNIVTYTITYIPETYYNGMKLCNALQGDGNTDCVTVADSSINVIMSGGLPKVYVPS